jgi:co-chaperonin GroES (HSP10)
MPIASLNPVIKKMRPLGNNLLVHKQAEEQVSKGIILPENAVKTGLCKADVIAVSAKVARDYPIRAGDIVHIPRVLGYQRVEYHPYGLCYFVPIESVAAVETK